jgi:NADH-quinone oxidoreductase subunit G
MCDVGRYAYKSIDENRLTQVQARSGNGLQPSSWQAVLAQLSQVLRAMKDRQTIERIGVILSTHLTNEDLYVAKRFFRSLGVAHLAVQPARQGTGDHLLRQADKSPNAKGAELLQLSFDAEHVLEQAARKELSLLYVCGADLAGAYGEGRVRRAVESLDLLIYQGSNDNATSRLAGMVLPSAVYAEKDGTFTNVQGRVQRIRRAVPPSP